jgi:hypothetical protein
MSTPPVGRAVSVTTKVRFDDFAGLQAQRNEYVESERFTSLGSKWILRLFPGVDTTSDEGMVSAYLYNRSYKIISIEFGFSVKGCGDGEITRAIYNDDDMVDYHEFGEGGDIAKRSTIMQSLVDGALVIEVHMKLAGATKIPPPFIPENPSCKILQGMFMDEGSADIEFEVGGQQFQSDARKKAKTSSAKFPAHQFILVKCSSTLAELCGSAGDKATPIRIPDVSPEVFRHLLWHLYGGKVADDDMRSHAKEILDAADKYGVVDLKLEAEASLVQTADFCVENLLDLLLYADSMNCALLKEAATDFMLENKVEVLEKISFKNLHVPGALVGDVLTALTREEKKGGTDGDSGTELSAMRVSELRWKAHRNGLNADGSREMLIAALEKGSQRSY